MKKILLFILTIVMLWSSCGPAYQELLSSASFDFLNCTDFFVYNVKTDEIYAFSENNDTKVFPASTTKLLTALVALKALPADTVITPGDEVYMIGKGSSIAYIRPNHKLTLEMLIQGMLLPSGNDAAYTIAAACGRKIAENDALPVEDAISVFVDEMNRYAQSLGCKNTHFTTPDGYAEYDHYTTVTDMALITHAAYSNDIIMKYASVAEADVVYASGHTNTWTNTNYQLHSDSEYYNEYVIGMKTGGLEENYSLVTAYVDGNTEILIGVFGSPTKTGRYDDTQKLIKIMTSSSK